MDKKKLALRAVLLILAVILLVIVLPDNSEQEVPVTADRISFASDPEFTLDPHGLQALQEEYGFQFDAVHDMIIGFTHEALRAGDVDAAMGFATDGKIAELDLVRLEDDRGFFQVNHLAPVIRSEVLESRPGIASILADLAARLDTDTMIWLNYQADIKERNVSELVQDWLSDQDIPTPPAANETNAGPVIVGSDESSEHYVLAQLTIAALERASIPVTDRTHLRQFEYSRAALLASHIDIHWECTSTQRELLLDDELELADIAVDEIYAFAAARDAAYGLTWLDYAPFVNSRAILMRREHAEELEIATIGDLAAWIRDVQSQTDE